MDSKKPQRDAEPQVDILKLSDGHEIKYTSLGDDKNPLLLFVVGSSGLGALYHRLAVHLSSHFRCVYYDKRGFLPRNTDHGIAANQQNVLIRAELIADDAAALIKHLSPSQPAYVFGTSTGGTAVLDLAIRYPEIVYTAILHEPITFSVMRDDELRNEMIALYRKLENMYDPVESFAIFAEYMFKPPQKAQLRSESNIGTTPFRSASLDPVELYNGRQSNMEALAMVEYVADEQKAKNSSDKLILICGIESMDWLVSKPGQALSQLLGDRKRLWELAGDHMSFAGKTTAAKFCAQLLSVLNQEKRICLRIESRQTRI